MKGIWGFLVFLLLHGICNDLLIKKLGKKNIETNGWISDCVLGQSLRAGGGVQGQAMW